MEDIEKLCEDLRKASYKYGSCIYGWHYFDEAANAIEELKAENERIRSNCYPRDGVQAIIDERDRFKAERDAAVKPNGQDAMMEAVKARLKKYTS